MRASFQFMTIKIQKLKASSAARDSSNLSYKSKASYKRSTECDRENTNKTMIPPMTYLSLPVKDFKLPL